jgi:hypothetical protein
MTYPYLHCKSPTAVGLLKDEGVLCVIYGPGLKLSQE